MDKYKLTIFGKSGHGAEPHEAVDATIIASEFIRKAAKYPNVDVISFNSGDAFNVISGKSEIILSSSKETIENIISSLLVYYGDDTSYSIELQK